jgi:hypothetical protein
VQRRSVEQLGDDERSVLVRPDVVKRDDVRMIELAGGARFLLEPGEPRAIGMSAVGSTFTATDRPSRVSRAR